MCQHDSATGLSFLSTRASDASRQYFAKMRLTVLRLNRPFCETKRKSEPESLGLSFNQVRKAETSSMHGRPRIRKRGCVVFNDPLSRRIVISMLRQSMSPSRREINSLVLRSSWAPATPRAELSSLSGPCCSTQPSVRFARRPELRPRSGQQELDRGERPPTGSRSVSLLPTVVERRYPQ